MASQYIEIPVKEQKYYYCPNIVDNITINNIAKSTFIFIPEDKVLFKYPFSIEQLLHNHIKHNRDIQNNINNHNES